MKRISLALLILVSLVGCDLFGGGVPKNPDSFTATATSDTQITLSWKSVENADGYALERKSEGGNYAALITLADTTYVDSALTPGTAYTYRVKATNKKGSSSGVEAKASTKGTTGGGGTGVLPTPAEFKVLGTTTSSAELSWQAVEGATAYTLERKTGNEAYGAPLEVSGTSYTDTGLSASTTYTYRLKAVNDAGASNPVEAQAVTANPGPSEVIVSENTRVADATMRGALVSADATTLRFNNAAAVQNINVGNVLVSEPSNAAPAGYLRKVTAKRQEGNEVVLETEAAVLTDVVSQGVLSGKQAVEIDPQESFALEPGVSLVMPSEIQSQARRGCTNLGSGGFSFDFDNTVIYENASPAVSVILNGCVRIEPEVFANADIRFLADIQSSAVGLRVTEEAEVEIAASADIDIPEREKDVYVVGGKPITFFIGPVPVVITPKFTVKVGVKSGKVSVQATYSVAQDFTSELGVQYRKGSGFSPISNTSAPNFYPSNPDPKDFKPLVVKARGYVTVIPEIKLYEFATGRATLKAFADIDFQLPRDPVWILKAGAEFAVDFGVDIFGIKGGVSVTTGERELWKNESPNFAPTAPAILSPTASTSVSAGEAVSLQGFAFDPEDGFMSTQQNCERMTWTLDNQTTINSCGTPTFIISTSGPHTISVTVTDVKGLRSTNSTNFTVGAPKKVSIVSPAEGAFLLACDYETNVQIPLKGVFAGGAFDTATWFVTTGGQETQIGEGLEASISEYDLYKKHFSTVQSSWSNSQIRLVVEKNGAVSVSENAVSVSSCIN
jgi:chitodextrinase